MVLGTTIMHNYGSGTPGPGPNTLIADWDMSAYSGTLNAPATSIPDTTGFQDPMSPSDANTAPDYVLAGGLDALYVTTGTSTDIQNVLNGLPDASQEYTFVLITQPATVTTPQVYGPWATSNSLLFQVTNGNMYSYVNAADGGFIIADDTGFTSGSPHFLILRTSTAYGRKLQVNNNLEPTNATATQWVNLPAGQKWRIVFFTSNPYYFHELQVYNYALSDIEVTALKTSMNAKWGSPAP